MQQTRDILKTMTAEEKALALTFGDISREIIDIEYPLPRLMAEDLRDAFLAKIAQCIVEPEETILGEHFPLIGTGAFKECYMSGLGNWIIKFCSESNHTNIEKQLLENATAAGVAQFFIPTYFVDLPFTLKSYKLESDDFLAYDSATHTFTEDPDFEFVRLDACELQPLIEIADNRQADVEATDDYSYESDPIRLPSGRVLSLDEFLDIDCLNLKWLRAAIAAYGEEAFLKFVKFISDFGISDLHNQNIGYRVVGDKEFPVIIDWLSKS